MTRALLLVASLALFGCPKQQTAAPAAAKPCGPAAHPNRVDYAKVPAPVQVKAAAGAESKYSNGIAAFHAPEDAKQYSPFSEFGWRDAITDPSSPDFQKFGPMPAGFWVYSQPYWVVWNLKDGKSGP